MSFHSDSAKEEDDLKNQGWTHDHQIIYEILKKRSQKPRKSWFCQEKDKKELVQKLSKFSLSGSEGEIKKMDEEKI